MKIHKIILEIETMTPVSLSQTTTPTIKTTSTTKTVTELEGSRKLFMQPRRHVARRTTLQRDVMLEPMQQTGYFLEEQTSTTGRRGQYNWLYPGHSPTS